MKRLPVKYIRDKAKSAYIKDDQCYICQAPGQLQLHHFNSITLLWERWIRKNNIQIQLEADILANRDVFISQHYDEIYIQTVTLCKSCHMDKLHRVFGKVPTLATAKSQPKWCEKLKKKLDTRIKL